MKNQIFKQLVSFIAGFSLLFVGIMPATAAGTANLFFSPSSPVVGIGATFSLDIMVNTGNDGQKTLGVDAILKWDANMLEYIRGDKGDDLGYMPKNASTDPLSNIMEHDAVDGAADKIVISALVPPNSAAVSGAALKVATVKFRAKAKTGPTNIDFVFNYDNPNDTTNNYCNVASSAGSELLASVTPAEITISATPPVTTEPNISSISPSSGDNTSSHNVTISGTNFGATQGTGWVHIGTKSATVTSWSDTSITVIIPAEPDFTQNSLRQIKVHRDDGQEATHSGFTYVVGGSPAPVPPPASGNMYISYIYPASGSKMAPNEITIYGGGFGFYGESSQVFIGLDEMSNILDWNDDRIVVQVPPRPDLTSRATLSVKVYNAGGSTEYLGYTYLGTLPYTGPEEWMWAGIIAAALAGSWLVYRKLNQRVEVVNEYSDYQF